MQWLDGGDPNGYDEEDCRKPDLEDDLDDLCGDDDNDINDDSGRENHILKGFHVFSYCIYKL